MKTYDDLYKKNMKVFGEKPTPLVVRAVSVNKTSGKALDLGAGQGRDSLFLALNGYEVAAVDSSSVASEGLQALVKQNRINNVQVIDSEVQDFNIEKEKYDLIIAINLLQLIGKKVADKVIVDLKEGLVPGGVAVITIFININGFQEQELREKFNDFEVLFYFEGEVVDKGHPGQPEVHIHHVARLIAKKL